MSGITVAAVGVSLAGSIIGGLGASSRAREARRAAEALERKIKALEASRPPIINPYASFKDLSGDMSNAYANLGVATQAAEMQIEEADISLANTLDAIRSTGASAGGATALAQAALESKKGVSASIEAQESQNQKLAAQGEMELQARLLQEKQRMQQAEASGKEFMYKEKDSRVMQQIQRAAGQQIQARSDQASANQAMSGFISAGMGAVAGTLTSYASMNQSNPTNTTTTTLPQVG